jgi:uncharacterized protein (TIGR02217 family)
VKQWDFYQGHNDMAEFLEERLPVCVRMGATYADEYSVEITQTANRGEYRRLVQPYPVRIFNVTYTKYTATLWEEILSLYHRCYGMYAGFRVKVLDDYTTNGRTGTPTNIDQILAQISINNWQLQVAYGIGTAISIGKPYRTIFKPVADTTSIAIDGVNQTWLTMWEVSSTTGTITFVNHSKSINNISQAASAVVDVGAAHGFTTNMSVFFAGVVGMTQINGLRGTITSVGASTITVNINSTAFTAYSSGGTASTLPDTSEVVTGGCEFDIPCRFNSRIDVKSLTANIAETSEIEIIELLNP